MRGSSFPHAFPEQRRRGNAGFFLPAWYDWLACHRTAPMSGMPSHREGMSDTNNMVPHAAGLSSQESKAKTGNPELPPCLIKPCLAVCRRQGTSLTVKYKCPIHAEPVHLHPLASRLLAVLRTWRSRSKKIYIPFSPPVCGGLVLYFSFTSLSIVLGLFLQPLHSGLFIFLYRHLHRLTSGFTFRWPVAGHG